MFLQPCHRPSPLVPLAATLGSSAFFNERQHNEGLQRRTSSLPVKVNITFFFPPPLHPQHVWHVWDVLLRLWTTPGPRDYFTNWPSQRLAWLHPNNTAVHSRIDSGRLSLWFCKDVEKRRNGVQFSKWCAFQNKEVYASPLTWLTELHRTSVWIEQ